MNITFLSQVYYPTVNGVVISMANFAQGLRELGHTVYVVANPPETPYKDDEYTFRWKRKLPIKKEGYALPLPFSKKIGEIFRASDIIHAHHPLEILIGAFRKLKWFGGKKLVYTYHTMYDEYAKVYLPFGLGETESAKKIIRKAMPKAVPFFCNRCDLVVAPSRGAKKFLQENGVKRRIEVIPTGIDVDEFSQADGSDLRKKYKIKGPLIIYTGRVAKEKNIDMLLDAYKRVSENHEVTLMLVGEADRDLELKVKSVPGVIMTGRIAPEKMPKYYNIPDTLFFVTASSTETQGITYLEAMSAGLPVVAMSCWGSDDFVKNGKSGYRVGSLEELVEKMNLLIDNGRLRKKMAKNAAERAEKYTVIKMARKLLRAYRSIRPSS